MGRTQSSERGQALGRRLVFKREKDGDREMEKQRFRDTRRDEERHGAGAEKERDTEMEKQGQKEDPHTHSQGEAGGGRESHGEGGAGRLQGRFSTQTCASTRSSGQELGGSHWPLSPCPPTRPQPGDSALRGGPRRCVAWLHCPSLPRGAEHQCPPCPGQAPARDRARPPLLSGPPFMVIVYAFAC